MPRLAEMGLSGPGTGTRHQATVTSLRGEDVKTLFERTAQYVLRSTESELLLRLLTGLVQW